MAFLGIFFFTYASIIEQEIVKINVNIVVEDLLDIISPLIDNNTKLNLVSRLKYPNMEIEDKKVVDINNNVMSDAITKLIIIFIITLVIGFAISYYTKNHFLGIIGLNLIVLTFIGLTEYTFLHMIVKKFIAADTNYVRYLIITHLEDKLNIDIS